MRFLVDCVFVVLFVVSLCGVAFSDEVRLEGPAGLSEKTEEKPAADKMTGSAALGFFNKYVFRGYELSRGSVVIQPSLSASYKGFTATFWGNMDTNAHGTQSFFPAVSGKEGHKWWDETDLTLSYTYSFGKLALTGGYIYYNLQYAEQTEELFVGAAWDVIGKPVITFYQDITSYPGTYINLAFAHSLTVHKERNITLDLAGSAAYMWGQGKYWQTYDTATGGYTGPKYKAFHDGMVKAALNVPITKAFVFQPMVQYWFPLSGDAKRHDGPVSYNPNGYLGTVFVYGANFIFNF
jgi:hypothetical protein